MLLNEYQKLAVVTCADPETEGYGKIDPHQLALVLSIVELAGKVGDFADILKKGIFHGHGVNEEALLKSLGEINISSFKLALYMQGNREVKTEQTPRDGLFLCNILGLVGEVGELANIHEFGVEDYHKDLRETQFKELGDIAWYLAVTSRTLGYTLEEVCEANVEKLRTRYPEGFKVLDSLKRVDVSDENVSH